MALQLWACVQATCTTAFYKSRDGVCPRCGEVGDRMFLAIRPPRLVR